VLHLAQLAWIEERGNVCFLARVNGELGQLQDRHLGQRDNQRRPGDEDSGGDGCGRQRDGCAGAEFGV
jgi:hypothetical protein